MNSILTAGRLKLAEILKQDNPPRRYLPLLVILQLLSWIYRAIIVLRNFFYEKNILTVEKVNTPVVSVGNLVVGGTGKTPVTKFLAEEFKEKGYQPAVICRGYGRENSEPVLVSDGEQILLNHEQAGDEAYLLASELAGIPVVVCQNKTKAARWVDYNLNSDIILVDDGFQHRSLARDYDLVLLDANLPFGNGYLLPRGFLREPPANLQRADAAVITRINQVDDRDIARILSDVEHLASELPKFIASYKPCYLHDYNQNEYPLNYLAGREIKAFSGIGAPDNFTNTLRALDCQVQEHISFPDHHDYTREDFVEEIDFNPRFSDLSAGAEKSEAELQIIVTTRKDFIKLNQDLANFFRSRGYKLMVLKMSLDIMSRDNQQDIIAEIIDTVGTELEENKI